MLIEKIRNVINYFYNEEWKGYDPYDGLNSPIFQYLFLNKNKYLRIFIIQFFKNFPINLRPLFLIKKELNPKSIALFLKSIILIYKFTKKDLYLQHIENLAKLLLEERKHNNLKLWGYNFDWQSRSFFIKKHKPNFVVSYFAIDSILELYKLTEEQKYKKLIINSSNKLIDNFLVNKNGNQYFKYIKNCNKLIHNVNFFGASLMSKIFLITKKKEYLDVAKATINTSLNYQNSNGSWPYGEERMNRWFDSFHTCYNLLSLNDFIKNTGIHKYEIELKKGFSFFINNFFINNSIIKYFNNKIYPIDIHSFTAGIITLIELERYLEDKEIIKKTYNYLNENFYGGNGIYYFRIYNFFKNKINYIRWNQAWALYCLVKLYGYFNKPGE
jgi:hypothetical protein